MSVFSKWKRLRDEVRAAPSKAKQLDDEITEALYRYRIHLTKLQTKPHLLDKQIWETYDSIVEDLSHLKTLSDGRLLRRPSTLSELVEQWHTLFSRQQELLEFIETTMERSNFYNKMETAKQEKSREQAQRAQVEAKLSEARRGLIQAIHYLLLRERSGESVTAKSVVLDLDQAIEQWEEQLQEALSWDSEEVSTEEQIRLLEELRKRIVDAPAWAENLRAAEESLDELLQLEEQLRRMTNRGQLADADIDEFVDLLRLDAAESWVRADWDELESIIDRIQGYVQREYSPLQSELYVWRKRRGKPLNTNGSSRSARPGPVGSRQDRAEEAEPTSESATVEPDDTELDTLGKAIRTRPSPAPYARTMVDPDADESIRRAFENSESVNSNNLD